MARSFPSFKFATGGPPLKPQQSARFLQTLLAHTVRCRTGARVSAHSCPRIEALTSALRAVIGQARLRHGCCIYGPPPFRRTSLAGPFMFRVKRILVPTDFSPFSSAAVSRACDLAMTFGAQLHLLHVAPAKGPEPDADRLLHARQELAQQMPPH